MKKASYDSAAKDTIMKSALQIRQNGGTWNAALAAAKSAGFSGSLTTLQRMLGPVKPAPASKSKSVKVKANAAQHKNRPTESTPKTAGTEFNTKPPAKKSAANTNAPKHTALPTLAQIENQFPLLLDGQKYQRPIALFHGNFHHYAFGELLAVSSIRDTHEALHVTNDHPTDLRGGDVLIDGTLNPIGSTMTVIFNSAQSTNPLITHPVSSSLEVQRRWDGTAFITLQDMPPKATLILINEHLKTSVSHQVRPQAATLK